jgi:integrase/recombinase XerD
LASCAPLFAGELADCGYAELTIAEMVRVLAHLSRWMEATHRSGALSHFDVEEFCGVRREQGCTARFTPRSLSRLWAFLDGAGLLVHSSTVAAAGASPVLLDRYERYLIDERGLVDKVVSAWLVVAARFLAAHEGLAVGTAAVGSAEVTAFCVDDLASVGGAAARNRAAALRSFLRFLHLEGVVTGPLAQVVPRVAVRKNTGLPRGLEPAVVRQLLASCDRQSGRGRRDHAILMVLARLGLRAGEVARLSLDDFDWRAGVVTVHGKGGRSDRLPLPSDVGDAIVDYLRCRPKAVCRNVFLRAVAPAHPLSPPGVTWVVYDACNRAGVPRVGAHRLRHTLATDVLRGGGSLVEVAQVLRHVSVSTSAIYAKVDVAALAPLARPWPGGVA